MWRLKIMIYATLIIYFVKNCILQGMAVKMYFMELQFLDLTILLKSI